MTAHQFKPETQPHGLVPGFGLPAATDTRWWLKHAAASEQACAWGVGTRDQAMPQAPCLDRASAGARQRCRRGTLNRPTGTCGAVAACWPRCRQAKAEVRRLHPSVR